MTDEERDRLNESIRAARTERTERIASFAVATAYEMGYRDDDLFAVRYYAVTSELPNLQGLCIPKEECDVIFSIASTFDDLIFKSRLSESEAIEDLRKRTTTLPRVLDAFLRTQRLIQPVTLDTERLEGEEL